MTYYVHASNAASAAASPDHALSWDRYNSAGPLAGARGYDSSWKSVGAAEGSPASPYQQGQGSHDCCALQYDGAQAWGGCYGGAYAGSYGDCYSGAYCGAYGAYGGYTASYGSPSAGGYGPQNAYILNMDQYSDASDSEDEEEKPVPKGLAKPSAGELAAKDGEKQAEEPVQQQQQAAEVAEPAPEPTLEGGPPPPLSQPGSPASMSPRSSAPASPAASPAGSEALSTNCGTSRAASETFEHDGSSASEPEAESNVQERDSARAEVAPTLPRAMGMSWRRSAEADLKVSPSSWAAQQRLRRGVSDGGDQGNAEVVRCMKSILNKLTVEKFPVLYQKLLASGIQTAGHAEALIREVFEKATTQHHFVEMYADLCALLQDHFEQNPVSDDSKFSFRRLLLNECQASFERNLAPPVELGQMLDAEERTLVEFRYKTRMTGNIRFVGALFARKMLASKVMFAIIEELLAHTTPEALESLAVLLTVVGPTFDRPEWSYHNLLCAVFQQIKTICEKADCNPRARCLLKDLLDLRERRWQDRRPKRCEGPTTLQDVARQAAAEERSAVGRASVRTRQR